MNGYFTDNNVSHTAMKAFSRAGIPVRHISRFDNTKRGIFYGMLRGCGMAMRILKDRGIDYWYVDNGYFDAQYLDLTKHKNMSGKYRIVKNQMIEPFTGSPARVEPFKKLKLLLLPPSPYSAFMHDITPEDWMVEIVALCNKLGHTWADRKKDEQKPLVKSLSGYDGMVAFNSMGIMAAIDQGLAAFTTHGVIRNIDMLGKCVPHYDVEALRKYYEPKQFTLAEIQELGIKCLQ